tara:strand:+ start:1420 stop:1692 length:273 start_codon:yes stop_codon:yes gene_type:complete
MNSVQITEEKNTITVDETTNTVTVIEGNATVIRVSTEGPQGPRGEQGPTGTNVDVNNAVNDSLVYFDSSSGTLKADTTTTKLTLVNGGNF